jgi:phosphate-selective porin OprO/OprP
MNKLIRLGILAAFAGVAGQAHADTAETKGGLKVKTDDGRFEANIGGRIHFDANFFAEDDNASVGGTAFGSNSTPSNSSTYFRRIYMTLKGKAYGWKYKIEPDFAGNTSSGAASIAFQDVYMSTKLGPGEIIIGQIKPFRGMEELTSSNNLTMIERPYASAAGIFGGGVSREFQQGVFYRGEIADMFTYGLGAFSLRRDNSSATEGVGYNGRLVFSPLHSEGSVLHVGLSYSDENPQNATNVGTSVSYAGRRGPSLTLGLTSAAEHATTAGAELAGSVGPFTAQAEYMLQSLDQKAGTTPDSQDIQAYYLQLSLFVTGESKPYEKADGVFGSPKPKNEFGAVELTARYDFAENKDVFSSCNVKDSSTPPVTVGTATQCEAQTITVGANYYANPNVRFMLNYVMGQNDRGFAKDEPNAIVARAQFNF